MGIGSGKCQLGAAIIIVVLFCTMLAGCGGSSSTVPGPAAITITPSSVSLNFGDTTQATAQPVDQNNQGVIATLIWVTSNPEVANPTPGGLICAGIWDATAITCTPGKSGVAQITATSGSVSSAAVTVYVHPQVAGVTVTPVNPPAGGCVPQKSFETFQAQVTQANGGDITPLVGPITWGATEALVAKVNSPAGALPTQIHVTSSTPGITSVFADVAGVTSQSVPFESCRIQSISLSSLAANSTTLPIAAPANAGIRVTALDRLGEAVPATVLNWNSTNNGAAIVKSATVTGVAPGTAAISASCAPPNCNINASPIYSSNVVKAVVTGTEKDLKLYVTSTDCGTKAGCLTSLVPISTKDRTAGTPLPLPITPNSFQFTGAGKTGYLGSPLGLIVFSPSNNNSIATQSKVLGKVLATSPDENLVLLSDTTSSPNAVRIFNQTNGGVSPFVLSGVTAAAFSADSQKAYMVSGSNLYVFSQQEAFRIFPLTAPANDVAFTTSGPFAFLAGGAPSAIAIRNTCDNAVPISPNTDTVPAIGTPTLIAPIPNGTQMVAVATPGIEEIDLSTTAAGCPPPITATGGAASFYDFGQGPFTAKQVVVSPDGTHVYVITDLPSILDFSTGPAGTGSVSTIPLASAAIPLSAAILPGGSSLFVGASDGMVHRVDTASRIDAQQIPVSPCSGTFTTCTPNLMALAP
jgi:hypothetical protein